MWSDFHLFSILAEFTLLHGLNVELHHLKLWSFTQCICFALSAHGWSDKYHIVVLFAVLSLGQSMVFLFLAHQCGKQTNNAGEVSRNMR